MFGKRLVVGLIMAVMVVALLGAGALAAGSSTSSGGSLSGKGGSSAPPSTTGGTTPGGATSAAKPATEKATGHPGGCSTCHVPHDAGGSRLWPYAPNTKTEKGVVVSANDSLCFSCHDGTVTTKGQHFFDKDGSTHPIDIKPSAKVKVPDTLPLDKEGKIVCTSCHNPHNSALKKYLRLSWDTGELCVACHADK